MLPGRRCTSVFLVKFNSVASPILTQIKKNVWIFSTPIFKCTPLEGRLHNQQHY